MSNASHPTEAGLTSYCRGEVSQKTIDEIEAHLLDCPECTRGVARIARILVNGESKTLPDCCRTKRELAEQFATAARIYSETVARLARDSTQTAGTSYDQLCQLAINAQERAEAIGIAFEQHIEFHRCIPRLDAYPGAAGIPADGTGAAQDD
jgi:anti-sigma factor RsiW